MYKLLPLLLIGCLQAKDVIYEAFESDGFGEWKVEGTAFGHSPTASSPAGLNGKVRNYANDYYVSSAHQGDSSIGILTSPEFTVQQPYLAFLVSGGSHPGKTAVQLLIDGEIVKQTSGQNDLIMRTALWHMSEFQGKKAQIRIMDSEKGAWGIINADHFIFTDSPNPQFPRTTKSGKASGEELVATDIIPGLTVPRGSEVQLFADHENHQVFSPTALTIGEKGEVYLAETHRFGFGVEDNRYHLYWLLDDLAAQTTADRRTMHEKWNHKKPVADFTSRSEIIRVLSDTDGDGIADESKVFADKFDDLLDGTAAGIMAFEGRLYFACIPSIWVLRDDNGDLVSDTREVLQDGFGVRVSFSGHDLNGFVLGPDSRLYATIGDRGFNITTKEGKKYTFPGQGAILRFDPDGSNFEVLHTGLRNPKEIAFDKYGTAITVDNNSDQGDRARVVVITDGGDSGWRMGHQILHSFHTTVGIPERPVNRWMNEKMWEPQNDQQPAYILPPIANLSSGPSGLAYHPGTGYELACKDRFLICDYRGSQAASGIWYFGLQPKGAGFKISESGKFNWGVGVTDLEWGYNGKLYVSDFVSGWRAKAAGRIYTLSQPALENDPTAQQVAELFAKGFSQLDAQALADLLGHPDLRVRLRAQYHLADRSEALALFTGAANQRLNELERIHGVWGLGVLARKKQHTAAVSFLIRLLDHKSDFIRGQVAQALGEAPLADSSVLLPLLKDPSPRVRALAALSLGRRPHPDAVNELLNILHENNNADPALRHAAVMGLLGCATADQIAELRKDKSPAVRLGAVIALRRLSDHRIVNFLTDPDPVVSDEVIRAIHDTYMEDVRPALAALLDDYAAGGQGRPLTRMMLRRLIYSGFRIGGEKNLARLIKVAANQKLPLAERRDITRLLATWATPHAVDHSTGKYTPLPARNEKQVKAMLAAHFAPLLSADIPILAKAMGLALQYDLSLDAFDSGTLTRLVRNQQLDGFTRSEALKLLLATSPEDPSPLLTEAAQSKNDTLANTALTLSAKHDPAANVAALRGALKSSSAPRRQNAWNIAATLPAEHAVPLIRDGLMELTAGKGDPASTLELLDAAKKRSEPALKAALAAYEKSVSKDDPLALWTPSLSGGDPKRGFKIFQSHGAAQCMRCHRHQGGHSEGGDTGPNLMGVALRHDARGLLTSLIKPSAHITSGFGLATVTLKNQQEKTGYILAEEETHLDLKETDEIWRISRQDIAKIKNLDSSMPPVGTVLTPHEVRDVVSWLLTLTKESGETPAAYETKDLVLATQTPSPPTPPKTVSEENTIDPAVMELGKAQYSQMICFTCHGQNGEGMPNMGPPLANSEWVTGPAENLIRIQFRGLTGPITVNGKEYNFPAPMIAMGANHSDENIAAVLTYVRNSFGNSASAVTPDMVAAHRDEIGEPYLTVADLIQPTVPGKEIAPPSELPSGGLGASTWGILTTVVIVALTIFATVKMKASQ